ACPTSTVCRERDSRTPTTRAAGGRCRSAWASGSSSEKRRADSVLPGGLFGPERQGRVQARGTPRRKVGGQGADKSEKDRSGGEGRRVGRRHPEEKAAQQPAEGERRCQAREESHPDG